MSNRSYSPIIILSCIVLLAGGIEDLHGRGQEPARQAAEANLAEAVSQVRVGDFVRALLTLNDVVSQLSNGTEDAALLARAHAYRALAFTRLDQPERAKTSVLMALQTQASLVVSETDFGPEVVALFEDAQRPVADPESAGEVAEQTGRFQEAFLAYLNAYQTLPEPLATADDQRLREKIIKVVRKLAAEPFIPQEPRDHVAKADSLLAADALLAGSATAAQEAAVAELRRAIRIAPWWPDATFKLATMLQKLRRFDEALLNLNLYRLADPEAYAAMVARATPNTVPGKSAIPPVHPKLVAPAVLYIYWPSQSIFTWNQKLHCNGEHVADLQKSHFFVLNVAPGTHTITFRDRGMSYPFEAGREYYLRASFEGFVKRATVRLTNPAEAIAEMREKASTPLEAARTFRSECSPAAISRSPR